MADAETNTHSLAPMPLVLGGLGSVGMVLVFAALVFLPAGRLDWTFGWIYVGIVALNVIITWVCLLRWNPVLIERRMRFVKGTKTWDKWWAVLYAPVIIAVYVVAGIEARDDVSSLPWMAWLLGLAIFISGSGLLTWSMVVNPFFEKTVRIQTEHGHRVIDTGPYAYVRRPGYAGLVGWILSTPLLLGSAGAMIPASLAVIGIVIRTALEDHTLYAELPGYAEYVARVRFRLLPGVW
jgi:protein-S-isoprenylcysteine O-methyltransferase Ste14